MNRWEWASWAIWTHHSAFGVERERWAQTRAVMALLDGEDVPGFTLVASAGRGAA